MKSEIKGVRGNFPGFFFYNKLGRLTKETKGDIIKTYQYDGRGNCARFNVTDGGEEIITKSSMYDYFNHMALDTTNDVYHTYYYNPNGQLLTEVDEDEQTVMTYSYGSFNWRTTADSQNHTSRGVYYKNGNLKELTNGTDTISYTYDGMNRLLTETCAGKYTDSYTYDRFGNISERVHTDLVGTDSFTETFTYDKNNRLLKAVKTQGEEQTIKDYMYDANGNCYFEQQSVVKPTDSSASECIMLIQPDEFVMMYGYDEFNRLTNAVGNGHEASYTYDANNLRQTKTVDGVTTEHIYYGSSIAADIGEETTVYAYGPNGIMFSMTDGVRTDYTPDLLNNIVELRDADKALIASYKYDAFGRTLANSDPDETNPFGYRGEYTDLETDNIYLRNRYYEPSVGRFITEDPAKDGLNWYVYCGNNPVNFVDPWGLYYIKTNDDGTYSLTKDTVFNVIIRSVSSLVISETITGKIESAFGRVGGNSVAQGDPYEEGSLGLIRSQNPYFEAAFKVKDFYDGASLVISGIDAILMDGTAFGLLEKAEVSMTDSDPNKLDYIMQCTYGFINNLSYFSTGLSQPIFGGESLHRIDYNLSQSKNPQKEIEKYYEKAFSYYISVGYNIGEAKGVANGVKSDLSRYQERREAVFALYGEYMNCCLGS